MPIRNPNWTRDELILALNLYFEVDFVHSQNDKNPKFKELSEILNSLPIHDEHFRGKDFRNPTGVHMKLSNFLRFDSNYSGKGLKRGSKLDEDIWNEFALDLSKLQNTAQSIKEGHKLLLFVSQERESENDEEFSEGKILTRLHKIRERNHSLTKKKKEKILRETGKLKCEVCEFDFGKIYGELGNGYAECHHTIPLSSLSPGSKTKLSDLTIICANCHRMLHRSRKWLSIEELKKILAEQLLR